MKSLSPSERLFLSVVSLLVGLGMLVFGGANIYREYQRFHSPLDQVRTTGDIQGQVPGQAVEARQSSPAANFVPVIAEANSTSSAPAPQLDITQREEYLKNSWEKEQRINQKGADKIPVISKPITAPERLVIPSLEIDASVIPVASREIKYLGKTYDQWLAPSTGDLGWHATSSRLGGIGNTVINGHSSGYGETFRYLETLENGDIIHAYAGPYRYTYLVTNMMVFKERWEPIEVRKENARWITKSDDERLTLISCWPYPTNTHRVVVVAIPVGFEIDGDVESSINSLRNIIN